MLGFDEADGQDDNSIEDEADADEKARTAAKERALLEAEAEAAGEAATDDQGLAAAAAKAQRAHQEGEEVESWLASEPVVENEEEAMEADGTGVDAPPPPLDIDAPRRETRPAGPTPAVEPMAVEANEGDGADETRADQTDDRAEMCAAVPDGWLRARTEAVQVSTFAVLDVLWGANKVFTCTVIEKVTAGETISAKVEWDLPDEANSTVILYSPSEPRAAAWRMSTCADALLLRLGAGGYTSLFRGPRAGSISAPLDTAKPCGVFNFLMKSGCVALCLARVGALCLAHTCVCVHTRAPLSGVRLPALPLMPVAPCASCSHLKNQKLKGILNDTLLSTCVAGDGADGADRVVPRAIDLYATTTATGVGSVFLCLGLGMPLDSATKKVMPKATMAFGLQVAVVAGAGGSGRGAHAVRTVEWRDGGKAFKASAEAPIVAHPLGESGLLMRRIESVPELVAVLGRACLTPLRQLVCSSELFAVAKELDLIEGRRALDFLRTFHEAAVCAVPGEITIKLASAGLRTFAKDLDESAREQARYYTSAKAVHDAQLFATAMASVESLVVQGEIQLECGGFRRELAELQAALTAEAPTLKVTNVRRTSAGQSADAEANKGGKRGKEAAGVGGASPAGKTTKKRASGRHRKKTPESDMEEEEEEEDQDEEDEADKSLPASGKTLEEMFAQAGLAHTQGNMQQLISQLRGVPASAHTARFSPLAAEQQISDPAKVQGLEATVAQLRGQLGAKEVSIAQFTAELAEERRTVSRLQGELTAAQALADKNQTLKATIAGLRAEISTKDQSLADLRHSQAMWSSMFMASKTDVKVDTFQALMSATTLAGKGSGSSGGAPPTE